MKKNRGGREEKGGGRSRLCRQVQTLTSFHPQEKKKMKMGRRETNSREKREGKGAEGKRGKREEGRCGPPCKLFD